jgi:hypothetical protein
MLTTTGGLSLELWLLSVSNNKKNFSESMAMTSFVVGRIAFAGLNHPRDHAAN